MTEDDARKKWPAKGKKRGHSKGYIRILCQNHPNSGNDGYVYENIYIGSLVLGRGLKKNETVHHIDGDTGNNKRRNLLICTNRYHQQLHARLEKSVDWPQFMSVKKDNKPICKQKNCFKKVPYHSATGYCVKHYWENYNG